MADEMELETGGTAERPSSIHDLRPKMPLSGRVTKIDLYGAFVDIGIGRDALIHISKLKRGRVNRVSEVLAEGEEVSVFVDKMDTQTGRVSLTMIKPLDISWNELRKGQVYNGKIIRLEQYGAFVDIGAERPGLIHISEMGSEFLNHPRDIFSVNDQVNVRVLDFDRKKRRIDFTLVTEETFAEADDEDQDAEVATAMELALRKALEDSGEPMRSKRKPRSRRGGRRRRPAQDDFLTRTLRNRKS